MNNLPGNCADSFDKAECGALPSRRNGIIADTLWRMERGDSTVALGALATAALVLQLHDRLAGVFVCFLEDNELIDVPFLGSKATRHQRAQDEHILSFPNRENQTDNLRRSMAARRGLLEAEHGAIKTSK